MALEIGIASNHTDLFARLRAFLEAGENAAQTLTLTGLPLDGETVTVDGKTYTFQATLTNADGNVLIGATMRGCLNNLRQAINTEPAGAGSVYAAATTLHPTARSVNGAGNTLVVRAKAVGVGGNAIATAGTIANGSWGAATMSGGGASAWTLLNFASPDSVIYEAPGLSGAEKIHIGFGYEANTGTDSYALTGWMFRSYNPALGHKFQPGHSGVGYHALWNQPTPYWFVANGQRVIVVTKISTVYTASYLGKFLMYGAPGEYPQPYARLMTYHDNTRWSSISENFRNFYDPGTHNGTGMLKTDGIWYPVANVVDQSNTEGRATNTNYIWPYHSRLGFSNSAVFTRYRELRDNLDSVSYTLWPLVLCGDNPSSDIFGELDGAYACSGFNAATEDLIYQDDEFHLLVQNCFRTQRYHYGAIRLK